MLDLMELNEEQFNAVTSNVYKNTLVIAGAGSGKTKVLTSRFAYLLECCNFTPDRIMAITFTKKASEEMKHRINNLTNVKLNYHNCWIANFHKIANKILRENAQQAGFSTSNFRLIDNDDQKAILKNEILKNSNLLDTRLKRFIELFNETEIGKEKRLNNSNNKKNSNNDKKNLNEIENFNSLLNNQNNNSLFNNLDNNSLFNNTNNNINNENLIKNNENNVDKNNELLDMELDGLIKRAKKYDENVFTYKQIISDINYFKERGIRADDYLNLIRHKINYENESCLQTNKDFNEYINLIHQYHFNNIENKQILDKFKMDLFFKGGNSLNMKFIYDSVLNKEFCENFYKIYKAYEIYCNENDIVDFSESLIRCYELLYANKDLLHAYQKQFQHILVDEFQDTNQLQYRWLSLLCNGNYLFVVGDDDQSIYSFRGAEVTNIKLYNKQYAQGNIIQLNQNYRSTQTILNIANAIINNNSNRIVDKQLITQNEKGNLLKEWAFNNANQEASYIVNDIIEKVKSGKNKYSDFTILYRNNAFSQNLENLLLKNNIPHQVLGGYKFYEREEIKHALAYIQLMLNPNDRLAFLRVINVPKRKNGDSIVQKIKTISEANNINYFEAAIAFANSSKNKGVIEFVNIIKKLNDRYLQNINENNNNKLSDLYKYLLEQSGLINYYSKDKNIEELPEEDRNRIENLYELHNALNNFEFDEENLNKNLTELLQDFLDFALIDAVDADKVGADQKEKITLMTIHKAKGLEFNNVYLIGMENDTFPSKSSDLEEERRLMYVAVTRAKKELITSWVEKERLIYMNKNEINSIKTKSIFLDEIPSDLKIQEDYTYIENNNNYYNSYNYYKNNSINNNNNNNYKNNSITKKGYGGKWG